jgi:hypothetical protein
MPGSSTPGLGTAGRSKKLLESERAFLLELRGGYLKTFFCFDAWSKPSGGRFMPVRPLPDRTSIVGTLTFNGVRFPHWVPALAALAPVVNRTLVRAWIRARRAQRGKCSSCGFDLRASSDRCPECGTAVN